MTKDSRSQMHLSLEDLLAKGELATLRIGSSFEDAGRVLGAPEYLVTSYDEVAIYRYGAVELAFNRLRMARLVIDIDLLRTGTPTYAVAVSHLEELESAERCLEFLHRRSIKYAVPGRGALSGHFCTTSAGVRIYCQIKAKLNPPSVEWSLANEVTSVSAGWL